MASNMSDTKITLFTIADKLCKHKTFSQRRRMSRHLLSKSVNAIWTSCFSCHILHFFHLIHFCVNVTQNTDTFTVNSLKTLKPIHGLHLQFYVVKAFTMLAGSFWMTAFQYTCIMNKYTCMSKRDYL